MAMARKVSPSMRESIPKQIAHHSKHTKQVYGVDFVRNQVISTSDDQQIIVAEIDFDSYEDISIDLGDVARKLTENPHKSSITRCVVTDDEEYLVTVDRVGLVVIWNTTTWTVERQKTLSKGIWGLKLNHTNTRLICGLSGGKVHWLNFATLEIVDIDDNEYPGVQEQETFSILGIDRHPTKDTFVIGGYVSYGARGLIAVLDVSEGDKLVNIFTISMGGWIGDVSFISDVLICGGGVDKKMLIWDYTKGSPKDINKVPLMEFDAIDRIRSLSISHDYTLLAAGVDGGQVMMWKLPEFTACPVNKEHSGDVCVAFYSKFPFLVSSGGDSKVIVYRFC
jgi:WD40 repeat protein